jgi:hypothetical protein
VERTLRHSYLDPLDAIWLAIADRVGFRVERSSEVYASTDGKGVMTIGDPSTLDPDDCLAQMILHELCHSLVEGARSLTVPDFGLDNDGERHVVREQACLRLQAWLTDKHGLRGVLAPTTDFRGFYDELPDDPFADPSDPATVLAKLGATRSEQTPWAPHLQEGLTATAKVLTVASQLGARDPKSDKPPIWWELHR